MTRREHDRAKRRRGALEASLWIALALHVAICGAGAADLQGDNIIATNRFQQLNAAATNVFVGPVNAQGGLNVDGELYVPQQGDIPMGTYTNGPGGTNFQAAATHGGQSYLTGCYMAYYSGSQVVISPGEGYCNGHYFNLTNQVLLTVSNRATAYDLHYIYVNDAASVYPHGVAFYSHTNEPSRNPFRQGWYRGNDRCVGAIATEYESVRKFTRSRDEYYSFGSGSFTLAWCFTPTGSWQTPSSNLANVCPVNAVAAYVRVHGADDATTDSKVFVASKEAVDQGMPCDEFGSEFSAWVGYIVDVKGWVPLGPSRQIRIGGALDDAAVLCCMLHGWRIER